MREQFPGRPMRFWVEHDREGPHGWVVFEKGKQRLVAMGFVDADAAWDEAIGRNRGTVPLLSGQIWSG
jgi:hypothetical protein